MDAQVFGQFIEEQRKNNGLTQKALADQIMVTDKAISRWENVHGFPGGECYSSRHGVLDATVVVFLALDVLGPILEEGVYSFFLGGNLSKKVSSWIVVPVAVFIFIAIHMHVITQKWAVKKTNN